MTDSRLEPVEAKLTPEKAVAIAIEFARATGVDVFECGGCKHIKDAEIVKEIGYSSGHGTYLVAILSGSVDDVMTVKVNDQTGESEWFWRL